MNITLREIDKSTWEKCCLLRVEPEQEEFIASNMYSLVQAAYEPDIHPCGIFYEEQMVGFLMWDFDSEIEVWELSRFMIDRQYQHKGFGTAALQKLLRLMKARLGPIKFYTSVVPENKEAIAFFEKMGFQKNGRIVYEEVMMEISL